MCPIPPILQAGDRLSRARAVPVSPDRMLWPRLQTEPPPRAAVGDLPERRCAVAASSNRVLWPCLQTEPPRRAAVGDLPERCCAVAASPNRVLWPCLQTEPPPGGLRSETCPSGNTLWPCLPSGATAIDGPPAPDYDLHSSDVMKRMGGSSEVRL